MDNELVCPSSFLFKTIFGGDGRELDQLTMFMKLVGKINSYDFNGESSQSDNEMI